MRGVIRILTDTQIEDIKSASIDILVNAGMKIKSETILRKLEKEGAHVDYSRHRAHLTTHMISRLLPEKHSAMKDWELQAPDADDLGVWGSHPFVLDWPSCARR